MTIGFAVAAKAQNRARETMGNIQSKDDPKP